jgi:hypothetical protein
MSGWLSTTESKGFCECGCGCKTSIAKLTNARLGHVKGQPVRFVQGHTWKGRSSNRKGASMPEESRRRISASTTGENNPRWNGGTRINSHGYRQRWVGVAHPMADAQGYVFEHRLVAAEKLGRWLTDDEIVHHEDEDKLNNDPSNLIVMSQSEHYKEHNRRFNAWWNL